MFERLSKTVHYLDTAGVDLSSISLFIKTNRDKGEPFYRNQQVDANTNVFSVVNAPFGKRVDILKATESFEVFRALLPTAPPPALTFLVGSNTAKRGELTLDSFFKAALSPKDSFALFDEASTFSELRMAYDRAAYEYLLADPVIIGPHAGEVMLTGIYHRTYLPDRAVLTDVIIDKMIEDHKEEAKAYLTKTKSGNFFPKILTRSVQAIRFGGETLEVSLPRKSLLVIASGPNFRPSPKSVGRRFIEGGIGFAEHLQNSYLARFNYAGPDLGFAAYLTEDAYTDKLVAPEAVFRVIKLEDGDFADLPGTLALAAAVNYDISGAAQRKKKYVGFDFTTMDKFVRTFQGLKI